MQISDEIWIVNFYVINNDSDKDDDRLKIMMTTMMMIDADDDDDGDGNDGDMINIIIYCRKTHFLQLILEQ